MSFHKLIVNEAILDIFKSIFDGFGNQAEQSVPETFIDLMHNVIMPLHKCQDFNVYHEILWGLTKSFLKAAPDSYFVIFGCVLNKSVCFILCLSL